MPTIALFVWPFIVAVGTVATLLLRFSLKAESGILLALSGIALGVCLLLGLALVLYCYRRFRTPNALTIYFVGTTIVGALLVLVYDGTEIIRFGEHAEEKGATEVTDLKWQEWRLKPTKRDGQIVELRSTAEHERAEQEHRRFHESASYPLPIMLQLTDLEVLEYDHLNAAPLREFLPKMPKLRRCTLHGVDLSNALITDELVAELNRLPDLEYLHLRKCLPVDKDLRRLLNGLRTEVRLEITR